MMRAIRPRTRDSRHALTLINTPMRTFSKRVTSTAAVLTLAFAFTACGPKDADVKAAAEKALSGVSGVTVAVADGVATLSGQFADGAAKTAAEATVKAVAGVKSVVDNATVAPPPPVISPDDALKTSVSAALKDFSTVMADVKDGVVTLTGEIKKADLPKMMQALSALHPKKIDNKATVKK